jgi:hypothetical protein
MLYKELNVFERVLLYLVTNEPWRIDLLFSYSAITF